MADRLEYQGNPLPSGLPGIGGPTVTSLNFPQQGTYFPPIANGPVVDIPVDSATQPPSPTAPVGNDPANPTTEVGSPGPSPAPQGGWSITEKMDKTPNCDALNIFLKGPNTQVCGYNWKEFLVCEDGSPKSYQFFIFDPESAG
jgi:hypothetical protein